MSHDSKYDMTTSECRRGFSYTQPNTGKNHRRCLFYYIYSQKTKPCLFSIAYGKIFVYNMKYSQIV